MICYHCEKEFEENEMYEHDGNYYCEDCESELFFICVNCGDSYSIDDSYEHEDELYCERCHDTCFCQCDDCGEYLRNEDIISINNGNYICESCFSNGNYFTCNNCCEHYSMDESNYHNGDYYCNDCYADMMGEMGIHPYSYKPYTNFLSYPDESDMRSNNLHIGIELEIQGYQFEDFCKAMSKDYYDDDVFYIKRDGSLDNNGVEIVSQPMTLKYITEGTDWKKCFDYLNEFEMNDTDNCGLHFHLDKQYLSEKDIAIIDYIVNQFSYYFENIGGRPFNSYCKSVDKYSSDWGKSTDGRYVAVNLENRDTVELRFCKSTYDFGVFLTRVKIIFALVKFVKKYNLDEVFEWNREDFEKKFQDNLLTYSR